MDACEPEAPLVSAAGPRQQQLPSWRQCPGTSRGVLPGCELRHRHPWRHSEAGPRRVERPPNYHNGFRVSCQENAPTNPGTSLPAKPWIGPRAWHLRAHSGRPRSTPVRRGHASRRSLLHDACQRMPPRQPPKSARQPKRSTCANLARVSAHRPLHRHPPSRCHFAPAGQQVVEGHHPSGSSGKQWPGVRRQAAQLPPAVGQHHAGRWRATPCRTQEPSALCHSLLPLRSCPSPRQRKLWNRCRQHRGADTAQAERKPPCTPPQSQHTTADLQNAIMAR
mmetsp:Transcript_68718/g.174576  ORF Transcript_68718/g.174576 Transcript_68718/m.174576 type:complete len:279 (-) Transcript_68718:354-1190(-)